MSVFLAKSLMSRRKCSKVATQNGKIMENWVEFCKWYLSQLYDSPKKVLWSDQKWFLLHQAPNAKNDQMRAPWDLKKRLNEEAGRLEADGMVWVG